MWPKPEHLKYLLASAGLGVGLLGVLGVVGEMVLF